VGWRTPPERSRVFCKLVSDERSHLVKKNRAADAKKKQKLAKYVPPTLVDYGNVTKITATPKTITGSDAPGTAKKGTCL
jgi:hypothetical protein